MNTAGSFVDSEGVCFIDDVDRYLPPIAVVASVPNQFGSDPILNSVNEPSDQVVLPNRLAVPRWLVEKFFDRRSHFLSTVFASHFRDLPLRVEFGHINSTSN
jgi:hypothetical protein